MNPTEIRKAEAIEDQLRAWDWLADLKADERTIPWLARHTGKSTRAIYAYSYGQAKPSVEWLRRAYRVLKEGAR